ncbi:hypothetical protein OUZ56_002776 [Daphnia magna]|uniref:Uncharacterized protein n=1 Tax=Daphnia magna TaxID=35525 RepID=A0ABR0A6R5_9CRUS|nr:hypothetical protein OUZ56_002776 [Daphnia magna]
MNVTMGSPFPAKNFNIANRKEFILLYGFLTTKNKSSFRYNQTHLSRSLNIRKRLGFSVMWAIWSLVHSLLQHFRGKLFSL